MYPLLPRSQKESQMPNFLWTYKKLSIIFLGFQKGERKKRNIAFLVEQSLRITRFRFIMLCTVIFKIFIKFLVVTGEKNITFLVLQILRITWLNSFNLCKVIPKIFMKFFSPIIHLEWIVEQKCELIPNNSLLKPPSQ